MQTEMHMIAEVELPEIKAGAKLGFTDQEGREYV